MKTDLKLLKLLEESKNRVAAMSEEEREEMFRRQREGYVKAEMSWPKPNFHWEKGVKVYHSMEDYYND